MGLLYENHVLPNHMNNYKANKFTTVFLKLGDKFGNNVVKRRLTAGPPS